MTESDMNASIGGNASDSARCTNIFRFAILALSYVLHIMGKTQLKQRRPRRCLTSGVWAALIHKLKPDHR
jgi:hypothetical protein